jgi:hypothetical protein
MPTTTFAQANSPSTSPLDRYSLFEKYYLLVGCTARSGGVGQNAGTAQICGTHQNGVTSITVTINDQGLSPINRAFTIAKQGTNYDVFVDGQHHIVTPSDSLTLVDPDVSYSFSVGTTGYGSSSNSECYGLFTWSSSSTVGYIGPGRWGLSWDGPGIVLLSSDFCTIPFAYYSGYWEVSDNQGFYQTSSGSMPRSGLAHIEYFHTNAIASAHVHWVYFV